MISDGQVETRARIRTLRRRLAVITAAQMMVTLDTTIMTIALPSAQRALGLPDAERQWVITAYTLAFGGLLLLGGRVTEILGHRRALLLGMLGFAAASAVGGAAANGAVLIATRALQGAFAALVSPSTLSLLTTGFVEPRQRAKAFSVFGAGLMSAVAIGLLLGGALTQYLGWRWCMYINLPIAGLALLGSGALPNPPDRHRVHLDLLGVLLGGGGLTATVYALARAGDAGWGSVTVLASAAGGVLLLVLFALVETKTAYPLVPPALLADRNRLGALLAAATATFGILGLFLLTTYQLQTVLRYSPLTTGFALLPYMAATVLVTTQLTARLQPRLPPRVPMVFGMIAIAAGFAILLAMTAGNSYVTGVLPALVLQGVGVGCVVPAAMSLASAVRDPQDAGIASALVSTAQQLGGAVGTTVLNTIATAAAVGYVGSTAREQGAAAAALWGMVITLGATLVVGVMLTVAPSRWAATGSGDR